MKIYFKLSECCITDDPIPQDVADKLLKYHIIPMSVVRHHQGAPVYASDHSVYRPVAYEKRKNRNGTSQHCFLPDDDGAGDWTADDLDKLLKNILEHSDYTRVTLYKNKRFIHCDRKYKGSKGIQYFESGSNNKWKFIKYIK